MQPYTIVSMASGWSTTAMAGKWAIDAVASGRADLVSFGRLFVANPDLVERLRANAPLNNLMGQETFYASARHFSTAP
jgi:2,4-dienoyl-CoA reductase-like NADH-dependent reductase (Old Yellow Enzyme family)